MQSRRSQRRALHWQFVGRFWAHHLATTAGGADSHQGAPPTGLNPTSLIGAPLKETSLGRDLSQERQRGRE